jgi:mono/diheme cytochrome c family protein
MTRIIRAAVGVVMLVAGVAVLGVAGQTTGPRIPPLAIESMYGPDLYRAYCATCHGRDGKGNGPAAAALRVPPSDLTALTRRHKGVFPASEVAMMIRGGSNITAHGTDEMPMWGPIFRALDQSDARAKARIDSLVSYIESIQQR